MYDKKKCPNLDILLVVFLGEIGPSFDIPDLWSFWARGIFSLDHSRSTGPENVFVWSEEKGFFFKHCVPGHKKNKGICFEQQRSCSRLPIIATMEIFAENFIFKACSLPPSPH